MVTFLNPDLDRHRISLVLPATCASLRTSSSAPPRTFPATGWGSSGTLSAATRVGRGRFGKVAWISAALIVTLRASSTGPAVAVSSDGASPLPRRSSAECCARSRDVAGLAFGQHALARQDFAGISRRALPRWRRPGGTFPAVQGQGCRRVLLQSILGRRSVHRPGRFVDPGRGQTVQRPLYEELVFLEIAHPAGQWSGPGARQSRKALLEGSEFVYRFHQSIFERNAFRKHLVAEFFQVDFVLEKDRAQ